MPINKSPLLLGAITLMLSGCNTPIPQQPSRLDMSYDSQILRQESEYLEPQTTCYRQEQHQLRTLNWERQELKRQIETERQQKKLARDLEAERQRKAYDNQRQAFQREQQALVAQQRELQQELDRQRQERRQILTAKQDLEAVRGGNAAKTDLDNQKRALKKEQQKELQQGLDRQREEQKQTFDAAHDLNAARNSGAAKADLHSELLSKVRRID